MKTFFHICTLVVIFLLAGTLEASDRFPVEGRLVNPDGSPLEAPSVIFKLQVFNPAVDCLLLEEDHTVSMAGTNGYFSLFLGSGSAVASANGDSASLSHVMDNSSPSMSCVGGGTFAPASSPLSRSLKISYDDGSGMVAMTGSVELGGVPYANFAYNSNSVGGVGPSQILQVNGVLDQANLETVFASGTDVTELRNLIDGSSTGYMVAAPSGSVDFNAQKITGVAVPTAGTDGANKNYVDQNVGGNTIYTGVLGAPDDGKVLTWNNSNSRWEATLNPAAGDINQDGNSFAGVLTLGTNDNFALALETNGTTAITIDSTQGVALSQGLGVANGINSGGNLSLQSESELRLEDSAGGEYVGFKAPGTVTSYTMELPPAAGAVNQVMQLDGSGNLVWANGGTGDLNNNGNSGVVTVGSTDTDTVVQATNAIFMHNNSTDRMRLDPNGDIFFYNNPLLDVNSVTGSAGAPLLLKSNAGQLLELDSDTAIEIKNGANVAFRVDNAQNVEIHKDLRFKDGSNFISLRAPSGTAAYDLEWPNNQGAAGEVLQRVGGVGLQWADPGLNSLLIGGNSTGGILSLGNNDNFALNIRTNGIDRLTIDPAGDFFFKNGQLKEISNLQSPSGAPLPIFADLDLIFNADLDGDNTGHLIFQTGAAERMRIANDGRVGINTNAPVAIFDVFGEMSIKDYFEIRGLSGDPAVAPANTGRIYFNDASDELMVSANGQPYRPLMSEFKIYESDQEVFFGPFAGDNATPSGPGFDNSGFGQHALEFLTTGSSNTAMGSRSLSVLTTGDDNTAVGFHAGQNITTGYQNVAIGRDSLRMLTTGQRNTAIGSEAGTDNTVGNDNLSAGYWAGRVNIGTGNTFLGSNAGSISYDGNDNVVIGNGAGSGIDFGDNNIFIGMNTEASGTNLNNELNIGNTIIGNMNPNMKSVQIFNESDSPPMGSSLGVARQRTASSPLQVNDTIGRFTASGSDGNPNLVLGAEIKFVATENWSSGSNHGTAMHFRVAKNGDAAPPQDVLVIQDSGDIQLKAEPHIALGVCDEFLRGTISSSIEGTFVCSWKDNNADNIVDGADNFGWARITANVTSCPANFELIGLVGEKGSFCIENIDKTAAGGVFFLDARSQCSGLPSDQGKAKVCGTDQWIIALDDPGFSATPNGIYLSGDIASIGGSNDAQSIRVVADGAGDLLNFDTAVSWDGTSDFRCCLD